MFPKGFKTFALGGTVTMPFLPSTLSQKVLAGLLTGMCQLNIMFFCTMGASLFQRQLKLLLKRPLNRAILQLFFQGPSYLSKGGYKPGLRFY